MENEKREVEVEVGQAGLDRQIEGYRLLDEAFTRLGLTGCLKGLADRCEFEADEHLGDKLTRYRWMQDCNALRHLASRNDEK